MYMTFGYFKINFCMKLFAYICIVYWFVIVFEVQLVDGKFVCLKKNI